MRRTSHLGLRAMTVAGYAGRSASVFMDQRVPVFILEELTKYPHSEDGGKYLGFVENNGGLTRIMITDFLPGGPHAKRTPSEFLPDGIFQERLFRQAERLDHRVEHLGSWHSHHCNGLETFSDGDIGGYFKTVNKAAYRPDFFLASLVTRIPKSIEEQDWLQHFLFARGDDQFYRVDELRIVDAPTTFGQITGHTLRSREKSYTDDNLDREATLLHHEKPDSGALGAKWWYESEIGRKLLAEDRSFFGETFGPHVNVTRKDGRIKLSGTCPNGSVISVGYPLATSEDIVEVNLIPRSQRPIAISCHLADRLVAVKGALCMGDLL